VRAAPVRRRHLVAILAAVAALAAQAPPSVKDVMRRVGAYVDAYGERASILVATERYTQEGRGNTSGIHRQRRLTSEFAIVKVDSIFDWQGFRDVFEVDGEPLPDRQDRLVHTLLGAGGFAEARQLSDESARYNIGAVWRNFNVPTSTLFYFSSRSLDRFKFTAKDVDKDGTWHIAFRETERPTFIRTPEGKSVPGEGDLWVNPEDGTILRTVLRTDHYVERRTKHVVGRVEVIYRRIADLAMWLPATMEEQFDVTAPVNGWERVEGRADYSNYRRFTTSVRIK
jgi:hypothetical protein